MMGQETKGSKDGKGKDSYYNWKDEKARVDERPVDPGPFPGPFTGPFPGPFPVAGQGKKDGWKGKSKDSSKDGNGKVHPRSSLELGCSDCLMKAEDLSRL